MQQQTFNEQDLTVTMQRESFEPMTAPWTAVFTRQFVVEHMHYNGKHTNLVGNSLYMRVYLEGDGFGIIDRGTARNACFDWSHIRDSSDEAFEAMANEILTALYPPVGDAAEYAKSILAQCMIENIDPLTALPNYKPE